ncbi:MULTISPECIES: ATP-binding protein [unclassified Fibrobacter]|uniref:hybrid sensor histidine kinase/response regulator n=1 Tax=unclassified Fibrobacter TaxID=2634177 RepID=UPI000D6BBD22|nr:MULTISPECIES: ATP-binding protein [unclassified Fibrobacter]PWJ68293.1 signal transduction histidine kinase [Fibrobacter sp. UWR4]PZW65627.1 signal transduction histidine kinase [Fibrobacter sp. UWR1]
MDTSFKDLDSQSVAINEFLFLLSAYDSGGLMVEELLQRLCEYYDGDRACVFEKSDVGEEIHSTFEWCKEGAVSVIENPRDSKKGTFKKWDDRFKSQSGLYIEVDEKLKSENPDIHAVLSGSGLRNLVVAPLLYKGEIIGTLAVENPRKHEDHLLLLSVVAGALYRGILFSRVQEHEKTLKKQLEDDIDAISGLASEYHHLLVIDLESGEFETYSEGRKLPKDAMDMGSGSSSFYQGFVGAMKFLCHPDDLEQMLKFANRSYISECLKGKKRFSTKFRCLDLEHNYIWANFIMIKFDDIDQEPTRISIGYVNTDAEVAAENARQKELKEALERAELANKAKTVFLSNMSHDIRTPMNAVLGFAKLMEKEVDHPEIVSDYLRKIRFSGEYLLSIINNVLDLASIDSGKVRLDEGFMDVMDASNSFDAIIEVELKRKNIKVIPTSDIKHRYVYADSPKLRQIMVNLVSNAVKYTGEGGEIHLDFRELPCDREGYGTYVTTVSDNGIGMSKEFQERIFESFSRERNTTDCGISGTGLGMSIVKRLVDLMGGKIEMESELGKGTTFRITNVHRFVESPEQYLKDNIGQNSENMDFAGRRILLAEDNELNAEIAKAILEDLGLVVDHVIDGVSCVDAMTKASTDYYDLILMDIQMPNMNGYEATREIRKMDNRLKANIPIYAMTANAFAEDRRRALEAGMDGHLAKPIDISLLLKALSDGFSKPACFV